MAKEYQTSNVQPRRLLYSAGALLVVGMLAWAVAGADAATPAQRPAPQLVGSATGLPLPRYVSLKSDRVNLREGPSEAHPIEWVYERAGLPVEITEEFDSWRKIRDAQGTVGWVSEELLSGRRTALVKPWDKSAVLPIFYEPDSDARVVAKLQSGVIGNVSRCTGLWCRIFGSGFGGWIQQTNLWGVYPNEKVD